MKKEILVPKGIRFISEWKDYSFSNFPEKCIIDKQIPGCGYTEWCIRNSENVILASPRRVLLQNKAEQHFGEVFLAISLDKEDTVEVDRDLSKSLNSLSIDRLLLSKTDESSEKEIYNNLKNDIKSLWESNTFLGKPTKILVTYDSYRMVKDALTYLGIFDKFHTVVDEFQTVLHDSRFKSTTELKFMKVLEGVDKVHFISATPLLDKYIQMLSDFKDLPYYQLNWGALDPRRIQKADLDILYMRTVNEQMSSIISTYKNRDFETRVVFTDSGEEKVIVSTEAVFYVNSVNHITSAIKRNKLVPSEVNILCANTSDNKKKINDRLNSSKESEWRGTDKFEIGRVPLETEPRKMFTFCTRTVYLGADFYSDNARSFIFSDPNFDSLAVDISQDLPQILGRQRLKLNPWRNSATFYYLSTIEKNRKDPEQYKKELERKELVTQGLLEAYNTTTSNNARQSLIKNYQRVAVIDSYKNDYVAVNDIGTCLIPVINEYARVSDIRAFDIQQIDYADRFSVFSNISEVSDNLEFKIVAGFLQNYETIKSETEHLRMACEFLIKNSNLTSVFLNQLPDSDEVKTFLIKLGPEKCRSMAYNITNIREAVGIKLFDVEILKTEVENLFIPLVGSGMSRVDIKESLQNIYNTCGYKKTAKAKDLEQWFELKEIKISKDSKRVPGYQIIKRKC